MTDLADIIHGLTIGLSELQRRVAGMVTQGPVHEVDAAAGTVRIRVGGTEQEPFLSPAIPYAQFAGALKVHTPPAVGQQMTLVSGSGDFRQGLAIPMTWSDQNPSPSSSGEENVATYGGFRIRLDNEHLIVTNGGLSFDLTASTVTIKVADVKIEGNVDIKGDFKAHDGVFTHDGHNVGVDHVHTKVFQGGALSGPPP